MATLGFPVFKTKKSGGEKKYDLGDPKGRQKYFEFKAGKEIKDLRKFLKKNTFVAFMMGKKNSGKGTYTKLFGEQVGHEHILHLSVGDVVRDAHKELASPAKKKALVKWLKENYRGMMPLTTAVDALEGRSTTTLVPTELILALVERAIDLQGKKKAVFIDGFPRGLDQISYALYFRHIMGYRDDPDFFVFIDVPTSVIAARMDGRVICPICHVPRHPRLMRTKEIGYDTAKKEFYLKCDNSSCKGARMGAKEGDTLGMEAIKGRLATDEKIMRDLLVLEGVPKLSVRNTVPVTDAKKMVDDYEITPGYEYSLDASGKVVVGEVPWTVKDDEGIDSFSLLPAAPVLALIKQIHAILGL
ncbi:MAG: nucleoside monophosphate kinase [Candidatus Paceibacterota bacterium]|jgi:adenylate kinase family enzyme